MITLTHWTDGKTEEQGASTWILVTQKVCNPGQQMFLWEFLGGESLLGFHRADRSMSGAGTSPCSPAGKTAQGPSLHTSAEAPVLLEARQRITLLGWLQETKQFAWILCELSLTVVQTH